MKFAKWLWLVTLIIAIIYSVYDYMGNGFNWRTIINLTIVVTGSVILLKKK